MGTVRGWLANRWLGTGIALLGIVLVVPSVLSPTWVMSVADREHGSLLSRQWEWSWGRVRVTGLEGVELRDVWNPLALVVLVGLLVAALGGMLAWGWWVLRRAAWGLVVGLVTLGLLTGQVLSTVSARVGQSFAEVDRGASGLDVHTRMTEAGSLETAGAVVLLLALALLGTTAIRAVGSGSTGARGAAPDVPVSAGTGLRPAGEHLSGPAVSFGEAPAPTQAPTRNQGRPS